VADHKGWLEAQGETPEMGGGRRILLPESYYPIRVTIEKIDVTDVKEDGSGGSVFAQVNGMVYDGPFAGNDQSARLWLTPGSTGGYIGWVAATVKAITGAEVNTKALDQYGIEPVGGTKEEMRESFRDQYLALTPDERLAFMQMYCKISTWDGRQCIGHVGHEQGNKQRIDEATGQAYFPMYGRWLGFYSLTDAKKGLAFVKTVCYPAQEASAAATVNTATTA
jgi:hypothetical protein